MANRRGFLTGLMGSVPITSLFGTKSFVKVPLNDLDGWLDKIKGSEKIVFDAPAVHNGFQVIWSWVFLDSHNQTGTKDDAITAVVVLRHLGIAPAFRDSVWKKYKFGKHFTIADPISNTPAERNPYFDPPSGEMPNDGMSIKKLQERGVLFCVCEKAIANNSRMIARARSMGEAEVQKDLLEGLLPGIQVVPSGVWAIQKVQQRGCAYCFAG
jgi:intracellular sulfur oxidation DsrE/DsrF family protein